jgi:ABC-type multidrug transport system fused ATPase/permease subunit
MHERASRLGNIQAELGISANEKTFEVITSYREIVVQNRRNYYARVIGEQRKNLANVQAELAFMPNVSKYVMEIAMVIGAILLSAFQFLSQNASHAVAVLSVFLAASTRIAPSLLRIQQNLIQVKSNMGSAAPTLDLIELLKDSPGSQGVIDKVETEHLGFCSSIKAEGVSFSYPGTSVPVIENLSLDVEPGEVIALVGPSGAGKTTLMDLMLGVLEPSSGKVSISGDTPLSTFAKWPGAVSYVPQDIMISNGSFKENVSMGYPKEIAPDNLVWEALKIAQLDEFVRTQPLQLDQPVGDRGSSISGGQRQRLGIARAMFTKPKMLLLDEATSALDGTTEAEISESIQAMKGSVTVVMIAHRLSTVKNADKIYYLEGGKMIASGNFDELRTKVPDFNTQALLMGL